MAGAGKAERNLKERPAALCPLRGVSATSVQERWRSLHGRYAALCGWDTAAKDQQTEYLDSRLGLLRVQQLVTRTGDAAAMPTCCQASISTPPRCSATLPGSVRRSEGPPGPS